MTPVLSKPIDRKRLFPPFHQSKVRFDITVYEVAAYATPFPNAPMGLLRPISVAHIRQLFTLGQR